MDRITTACEPPHDRHSGVRLDWERVRSGCLEVGGERLPTLARREGVSVRVWLLAISQLLVSRWSAGGSVPLRRERSRPAGPEPEPLPPGSTFAGLLARIRRPGEAEDAAPDGYAADDARFDDFVLAACEHLDVGEREAAFAEASAQFCGLLAQTLDDPRAPVESLSLVTPNAARLLPDPGDPLPVARRAAVTRRFLEWAAHQPNAPALSEGETVRSYSELERAARAMASQLRAQILPRGALVAVELPRGFDCVASMLGVLLAGHPVLPLDPALPPRRRERMLDAADVALLISNEPNERNALPWLQPRWDDAACEAGSGLELGPEPEPEDGAYVFFTSGTTGAPKGVRGSHGGLAHFLDWQSATFDVSRHDRIAHVTGLSFDVVLREIFLALTSGACLCVPSEEQRLDPVRLVDWLRDERVSRLHAVPTVAKAWLDEVPSDSKLPHLRSVFFAGEPLTRALVLRWRQTFGPPDDLINLYGPTETTLAKCWQRVPEVPREAVLGVGRALPESQLLVLSPERRRCGIGEPGEVWIRTPWRSLGYVNAPSPFVANPFGDDPQDLLYPTGDRGRVEVDSSLSLLGRLDDQVKIRGVRVEPAEVAAVLEDHPQVRAACVLASDSDAGKRLTAHLVATTPLASRELRDFLGAALPDAMIPAEFRFLDRLPRTPNGKVDRDALSRLQATEVASRPHHPPRNETERTVAGIWEELLGVRPVGASDDFFDLGGDSLRALACVARLRDRLGTNIAVADAFEHRTVAELARHIEDTADENQPDECPLVAVDRSGDLPLSFAQERLWFQCQLEGESSTSYNVPIAVSIRGEIDPAILARCLSEIVRRHEALRSFFPLHEGTVCQRVAEPAQVALPVVDLSDLDSTAQVREVLRRAEAQVREPFDLSAPAGGMLLRALLIARSDSWHDLHLTIHHLGFDGWSRWLLVRELGELYNAFSRGRPSPLRRPAIQYGDFAVWRRENPPDESVLSHWRERLEGAPTLEIPGDRPRPRVQNFASASVRRVLPDALCGELRSLANAEGATLFMALLTGFQSLLLHWTGQRDITVGTPIANRTRPEVEDLLGCFIDTLPLRTNLSGDPSFRKALERVRTVVLDAFDHSDLRFERLVQELKPARDPSRHPIFDVMFNLVNVPRTPPELTGIEFSFPEIVPPESHFAFTLYAREWEGAIELRLVYQTALFDADRMERFLSEFESLLRTGVSNPDQPLSLVEVAEKAPLQAVVTASHSKAPARFEPPTTPMELQLTSIWSELLARERISLHDNFFDLGGHSLLATRVLYRIRRALGVDLPLRILFENQTIGELARAVALVERGSATATRPEIVAGDGALSMGQRRLWDFARRYPESAHYNVPRAARFRGPLDPNRLERAIREVVRRHPVLRSQFEECDGRPIARIRDSQATDLVLADARSGDRSFEQCLNDEIETPFDLSCDPLLRATLVRMADDEHILLVSVHHIVADCWSMGMPFGQQSTASSRWMAGGFFREMWSLYHSQAAEQPPRLAALDWSFADAVAHQNAWLASGEADDQIEFWRNTLAGSRGPLEVRPDFERPPLWDFKGARPRLRVDRDLTDALRALARRHETTLFATLLAAFDALLAHLTGEDDILVGTTAANRARWNADELIGFFSNNLLLRTNLSGDPTFSELVLRTRETAFAAWAHQELPFERIVEVLEAADDPSRHPLFQTRFILHQPDDESFCEDGLSLTPLTTGREVAKYDLTLLLADDGRELNGWIEYATSLYAPETIDRMRSSLLAFLRLAVAGPEQRLSEIWHRTLQERG